MVTMRFEVKASRIGMTPGQMNALDHELCAVLDELAPLLIVPESKALERKYFDKAKAAQLFDIIEPLLESDSLECLELVEGLKEIPKTDVLIKQMEDYDYEMALETLAGIRLALGIS